MKKKLLFLTLALLYVIPVHAQNIFVVTHTSHGPDRNPGDGICATLIGLCTFRAAIEEANAAANVTPWEPDEIHFAPIIINNMTFSGPGLVLPTITDDVIIDGTTAPGDVIINGRFAAQPDGIVFGTGSGQSIIRGLTIGNFSENGILIDGGIKAVIEGNYIGTDRHGNDMGNGAAGVNDKDGFSTIGTEEHPNIIGFNQEGIRLDYLSSASVVQHNFVGTNSNGDNLSNDLGIRIDGNRAWIRNNVFGFSTSSAVLIQGDLNRITGNYIGTNQTGDNLGNGGAGIFDLGVANEIGGVFDADGNVIGFNDSGILLYGSVSRVESNYIGTDRAGRNLGNADQGIVSYAPRATIGSPVAGNTIGFNDEGITIFTGANLLIRGNYIGTNKDGVSMGNTNAGIRIDYIHDSLIGGDFYGAVNTIADNGTYGIHVTGRARNFRIEGNYIGTNAEHIDLGNQLGGIFFGFSVWGNSVIGYDLNEPVLHDQMGKSNYLFFNKGPAITFENGIDQHTIRGNAIGSNDGIGIDLGNDGLTQNDGPDEDKGANTLLNSPDLNEIKLNDVTGQLEINYIHTAAPELAAYPLAIDFYLEDEFPYTSQGLKHIASTSYPIAQDLAVFAIDTTGLVIDFDTVLFTATATDSLGNTSEFGVSLGVSNPEVAHRALLPADSMDTHLLNQAFPNPFNPSTSFELVVRESGQVHIAVYDMLGRRVATLHDGMLEGERAHNFTFNAAGLASGSYLLLVQGAGFRETMPLQLIK